MDITPKPRKKPSNVIKDSKVRKRNKKMNQLLHSEEEEFELSQQTSISNNAVSNSL